MTYDQREAKLPVWAQEIIAAERTRADLCWPSAAEPEPLAVLDSNHTAPSHIRGLTVWRILGGYHGAFVKPENIREDGYAAIGGSATGSRIGVPVYATKADAILAAWWRECRASAAVIHKQAQAYRETAQ